MTRDFDASLRFQWKNCNKYTGHRFNFSIKSSLFLVLAYICYVWSCSISLFNNRFYHFGNIKMNEIIWLIIMAFQNDNFIRVLLFMICILRWKSDRDYLSVLFQEKAPQYFSVLFNAKFEYIEHNKQIIFSDFVMSWHCQLLTSSINSTQCFEMNVLHWISALSLGRILWTYTKNFRHENLQNLNNWTKNKVKELDQYNIHFRIVSELLKLH